MPRSSDSFEDSAARMDRMRRTIGLFLGPALFVVVLLLPTELDPPAHRLAAVFVLVIVFWISEAIPLAATALLGPALAVVLGVAPAKQAFAQFGHPIIFLFLGSFLIAGAMRIHGLDRRIALFALSRRWVGDHPGRILFAFGAIAAFLSMWMSNTATTAMMLPIGLGVLTTLSNDRAGGLSGRWPYATGLMLMIAYSCNVGGIGTPVGSPPNLIAIGMIEEIAGRTISFFEWMSFGVPISILLFVFLYFAISRLFRVRSESFSGATDVIRTHRAELGPWTAGQRAALIAFLTAVVLWTLPGFTGLVLGREHSIAGVLRDHLAEGPSAIIAATLLFLIPIDWPARRFALNWSDAVKIDWGTILLFGGGAVVGLTCFCHRLGRGAGPEDTPDFRRSPCLGRGAPGAVSRQLRDRDHVQHSDRESADPDVSRAGRRGHGQSGADRSRRDPRLQPRFLSSGRDAAQRDRLRQWSRPADLDDPHRYLARHRLRPARLGRLDVAFRLKDRPVFSPRKT
jgi:sodium-dependent dicarboxylate transporter 2/3/5